jgi:poly-gamma-glutamate capsule biosynthesis protein CapA/YwtB (metallophosphatase superfamily)
MHSKSCQVRIAAVGDVALLQRPSQDLWRTVWDSADVRLANLEGPIVTGPGVPAEKLIRLRLPAEAADWLRELNTTAVSLANNHLMDWGREGLEATRRELDRVGIKHSGAGINAEEAAKPAFIQAEGYKIAFLSWASTIPTGFRATERRPGIAGIRVRSSYIVDGSIADEQPGTPPWVCTEPLEEDLAKLESVLQKTSAEADFVVLALHWGVPPQWASPFQGVVAEYQPIVARRAIAAGAGVIVGHHCHAPYGVGTVDSVPILYSLGNYIFHSEYLQGGLDYSPVTVPYIAQHLPENEQSCVAELELVTQDRGKKLRVRRLTIHPAILNKAGEAVAVPEDTACAIAHRLRVFSEVQGAQVRIEGGTLVWEANN